MLKNIINKIGFNPNNQFIGFLSVVLSGQIIYSAFGAFKGTFYNLLLEVLNIDNTQMMVIIVLQPTFTVLAIIAGIWDLTDAVFWPSVVSGAFFMLA